MDVRRLQPAVPIVVGAFIAIMWVTVQGTPALVVTIIGGAVIGLFSAYVASRRQDQEPPGDRATPPAST